MVNKFTALPMPDRFWSKVDDSNGPEACWLWRASLDSGGYGTITFKRKLRKAHRMAWILTYGEIPEHLDVLHKCDVPACVNPAHLFLGTHLDNMRDCVAKGRHAINPRYGEANPMSKLTNDQVEEIRRYLGEGLISQAEIARRMNISPMAITRIKQGVAWSRVGTEQDDSDGN